MVFVRKNNKNKKDNFWIGFSDLMTGLMLVFIILSLTFMAIAKEKLDEIKQQRKSVIVILSEKLASNNIKVEYDSEKGTVTIAQDILFVKKKADLNSKGRDFIKLFARILDQNIFSVEEYKDLIKYIHIEGYASKEGSPEYNFFLSFKRAQNVWFYMTKSNLRNNDIMKRKLNIVSRGEIEANQDFINESDRKVVFRFEFYDTYNKIFEGLSK